MYFLGRFYLKSVIKGILIPFGLLMSLMGCSMDSQIMDLANSLRNVVAVQMQSSVTSPSNASTIPVSLAFSEDVADLSVANIEITGGTISGFTGAGSNYSFLITPSGDGMVRVHFPNQRLTTATLGTDGLPVLRNSSSSVLQWVVDTARPQATLSTTVASPTNLSSIPVSVVFSESVSGLEIADFVVSGAASIIGLSGSGSAYVINVLPSLSGLIELELPQGAVVDQANNPSYASNKLAIIYDVNIPVPVLSSSLTSPTNASTIPVAISFGSINVTGLELSDFVVSNGQISNLAGSGSSYTLDLVPDADGVVTLRLPAGVVENGLNTPNLVSNTLSITVDRVAPTLTLSGPTPALGNSTTAFVWTVNYTGASLINLSSGNITFGGTATGNCSAVVSGNGASQRTVTVTGCTGDGSLNISVAASTATDAAGNTAAAAGPSANATVDNTGPSLSIAGPTPAQGNSSTNFVWTVTYTDHTAISLSSAHISLATTGTVSSCATSVGGSGNSRSVTVTGCQGDGSVKINIAANSAQDSLGNAAASDNTASSASVDNTAPTLVIGAVTPSIGNSNTVFRWPLTYSGADAVSLVAGNVSLTGTVGTAGCLVQIDNPGGVTQRYVEVTGCTNAGTLGIAVAANTASDLAGNRTSAVTANTTATIDNTAFTVALASGTSTNTNATVIPVTVTFSESTTTFSSSDLTVTGATVSNFTGSGASYAFELTAMTDGSTVSVQVPADSAQDSFGNQNTVSNTLTFNIDRTRPTLAVTGPVPALGNSATSFVWTVTYTGADTISLASNDVTLGGTTAGCGTPTVTSVNATTSTVAVTGCTGNGVLNIQLAANTAQDLAGNQALASSVSSDATVDNIRPTLAFTSVSPLIGNSTTSFVWTVTYTGADTISLASNDVTLGGTTAGCGTPTVTAVNATTSTVAVTGCTGTGVLNIQLAANTAQDLAGNQALASAVSSDVTVDNAVPTLTFSAPNHLVGNEQTTFLWTVDYSKTGTLNLGLSNVTLVGADTSGCEIITLVNPDDYNGSVIVKDCTGNGTIRVQLAAGSFVDSAGNTSAQVTSSAVTVDNEGPTLNIAGLTPALGNSSTTFQWTVTYAADASVISLADGDVTLTGTAAASCAAASVSATGNPLVKNISVSNCTGNGTLGLVLAADTARDTLANRSLAGTSASMATVDNIAPTLTLASPTPEYGNGDQTFTWLATYGGASNILLNNTNVATYVTLSGASTGCELSVVETSATERQINVLGCTGNGILNLAVAAGTASDSAGNLTASVNGTSVTVDNQAPTLSLGLPSLATGNSTKTFSWVVTYSESVNIDLDADDITLTGAVTGCTKSVSGVAATTRTVSVTGCSGDGVLGFSIDAGTATDLAGNPALDVATTTLNEVTVDNTAPGLTISTPVPAQGFSTDRFVWTVTYTDVQSITLTAARVTVVGDSIGCTKLVSGSDLTTRTVTLSNCTGHTEVGINIASGTAVDAAGNLAPAATFGDSENVKLLNAVQVNFAQSADTIIKGAGVVAHEIPVVLEKALPVDVEVGYKILNQTTAVNPTNYDFINGTVTIPAGQTTANITYNYEGASAGSKIVQVALAESYSNGYNLVSRDLNIHRRLVQAADTEYSQISTGTSHTCAVTRAGALRCWGNNNYGQLGNGSVIESRVPVTIGSGYASVSVGYSHTCAISTAGALRCWGRNNSGQLGNNSLVDSSNPVSIASSGYASVSAAFDHTCAITTAGALRCWGSNVYGQLGNNTNTDSRVPVSIASSGYASVSAGSAFTCAITTSGGLRCWGINGSAGKLGNNSTIDSRVPVTIASSGYVSVSAGGDHACAITTAGGLQCWGRNSFGQLGINSTTNSMIPANVATSGYANVIAGSTHTCAVTTAGGLQCWGYNFHGQLGNNTTGAYTVPVTLASSGYASVSAGDGYSCAVATFGGLQCWGNGADGQLGNAYEVNHKVPTALANSGYASVSAGSQHSCVTTTTGGLQCWGRNADGQLGNNSLISSSVPVSILNAGYVSVSSGDGYSCAITTAGKLQCWGVNGGVFNTDGRFGNNTTTNSRVPINILYAPISEYTSVTTGSTFSCTISPPSNLQCSGSNSKGQLGANSLSSGSNYPLSVGNSYASVSAGHQHACAITTSGGLRCWGSNSSGQLGNNSLVDSNVPVTIATNGYASVSAGRDVTCAITTAGGLRCWGKNGILGQLGNGSTTDSGVPVTLASSGYVSVSTSSNGNHTCAITTVGGLRCWGGNQYGQLGNNTTTHSTVPLTIASSGYASVSAGERHTCAITTSGGLQCWGNNQYGQIGEGTLMRLVPSSVNP